MILQKVYISASPRDLHIKLFKARGAEYDAIESEIERIDSLALEEWGQVFDAVRTPGVVAHWEVQFNSGNGKKWIEQRILHASVKKPGFIQYSTAYIYPKEFIPVMDSQFRNAKEFFESESPKTALVIIEKVA